MLLFQSSKMKSSAASGFRLPDIILGGQDGLVNVLGIVLGIVAAGGEHRILIAASFAAAFAEAISMGAVAYTSTIAARDYEIKFKVQNTELKSTKEVLVTSLIVGITALLGAFIPIVPFMVFPVSIAMPIALIVSAATLFSVGVYQAKTLVGVWWKTGLQMTIIGMGAAFAGFFVGKMFGAN